jgi:hypothetical protein
MTEVYKCQECAEPVYLNGLAAYVFHALTKHPSNCLACPNKTFRCPYVETTLTAEWLYTPNQECLFEFQVNAGRFCEEHFVINHPNADYKKALKTFWKKNVNKTPINDDVLVKSPNLNATIVDFMQSLKLHSIKKIMTQCGLSVDDINLPQCVRQGLEQVIFKSIKVLKAKEKTNKKTKTEQVLKSGPAIPSEGLLKDARIDTEMEEQKPETFARLTANAKTAEQPTYRLPPSSYKLTVSDKNKKLLTDISAPKVPLENTYVQKDQTNGTEHKNLIMSNIAKGFGNEYYLLTRKDGTIFLDTMNTCLFRPSSLKTEDSTKLPPSCPKSH